ncbi:MAG: hypothetical protein H0U76_03125 [Ktedonobacteraceae bacterium]|nr:hypothetical protein [Ktedonobacteraceae bacterium]MBA3916313.1 hypothetical protein [Terriglobales bacterium]
MSLFRIDFSFGYCSLAFVRQGLHTNWLARGPFAALYTESQLPEFTLVEG